MKQIALLLIAIVVPSGALAQALPENPAPAKASSAPSARPGADQSMRERMESFPRGQKIKIQLGSGRWDHCVFAGVSDEYIYCASEADSGVVREHQIDRLNVTDFKPDHDVRNGRLIFTAVTVGSGLALGIHSIGIKNGYTPTASGVLGGLIGAGLGALAGVPLSCISGHCVALPSFDLGPPVYGVSVHVPLRYTPHRARGGRPSM